MDILKKERLEARGWKVSTTSEFLELTPAGGVTKRSTR